jgi:hypothetical protein
MVESVQRFLASLEVLGHGGSARVAASAVVFEHVWEGLPNLCADKRVRLLLDGVDWVGAVAKGV